MKAVFKDATHIASDIWTFSFIPEKPLSYIAGQFIELSLSLLADSKDKPRRWFTLSSSPTEANLEITTRIYNEDKRSDFKAALFALSSGDVVNISDSMGDFVPPRDPSLSLLFIAGGIGITPYRSIIKSFLDTNDTERNIYLLHTANNKDDQVFKNLFLKYTDKYSFTTRKIDFAYISEIINSLDQPYIYISGPEGYVEKLRADLIAHGYSAQQIIGDYFPGYK